MLDPEDRNLAAAEHNRTHLIPFVSGTNPGALEDLLLVMAKNVEAAMVASGAKPRVDYTHLDLFKLAAPFALEVWKENLDNSTFRVEDF